MTESVKNADKGTIEITFELMTNKDDINFGAYVYNVIDNGNLPFVTLDFQVAMEVARDYVWRGRENSSKLRSLKES